MSTERLWEVEVTVRVMVAARNGFTAESLACDAARQAGVTTPTTAFAREASRVTRGWPSGTRPIHTLAEDDPRYDWSAEDWAAAGTL